MVTSLIPLCQYFHTDLPLIIDEKILTLEVFVDICYIFTNIYDRTLEYLTKHLHRVSLKHPDTGMTAKNVAIVWAPNLLRCKSLEVGGVAALQGRDENGNIRI